MNRSRLRIAAVVWVGVASCKHSVLPDARTPAPKPAVSVLGVLMDGHFSSLVDIKVALLQSQLDAARTRASTLAPSIGTQAPTPIGDHEAWQRDLASLHLAVLTLSNSVTTDDAATALANAALACGACHERTATTIEPTGEIARPARPDTVSSVMWEHWHNIDRMWLALIIPSDELWRHATRDLIQGQWFPEDFEITDEMHSLSQDVHELSVIANQLPDRTARAGVLGEIFATCSACHQQYYAMID